MKHMPGAAAGTPGALRGRVRATEHAGRLVSGTLAMVPLQRGPDESTPWTRLEGQKRAYNATMMRYNGDISWIHVPQQPACDRGVPCWWRTWDRVAASVL